LKPWLLGAFVVLACAVAPLFAPQVWAQHGAFPDLAALAVLWLAISGTPERAAVLGVAIGLTRCAWTPEPLGLDAALYGTLGWSGAHFGRAVFQDRILVKMAAAGLGVIALRALSAGFGALTASATPGHHGMAVSTWLVATLAAAVATALAAPVVFAALRSSRVLAAFERRRKHDV
jgi:rod shape-determining protein MreD